MSEDICIKLSFSQLPLGMPMGAFYVCVPSSYLKCFHTSFSMSPEFQYTFRSLEKYNILSSQSLIQTVVLAA